MSTTGIHSGGCRGTDPVEQQPHEGSPAPRIVRQHRRCLSAAELTERLEEEIARCLRQGAALCCLVVRLEDFASIAEAHGAELADRALLHACEALLAETRRFDRIGRPLRSELLVLLPGADAAAGEAVARRGLARLRAIKIEAGGRRAPLSVAVSIAAWQAPWSAQRLIDEARAAAGSVRAADAGRGAD